MRTTTSTFALARALGGGAILAGIGTRYTVSDFSPATGEVYGWPVIVVDDVPGVDPYTRRGDYQRLPDDLCEPMPNRAAYMAPKPEGCGDHWRVIGAARHAVYYGEAVTAADKSAVLRTIGEAALMASTDPHLNDIPLGQWDMLAASRTADHARVMRERGQGLSQSDGVCILKAAARAIIAERRAAAGEA